MQVGILSKMKAYVVPHGRKVYSIRSGILGGMKMNLDLRHQTRFTWVCQNARSTVLYGGFPGTQ